MLPRRKFIMAVLAAAMAISLYALGTQLPAMAASAMTLQKVDFDDIHEGFYNVATPQLEHYSSIEVTGSDADNVTVRTGTASTGYTWRLMYSDEVDPRTIKDLDLTITLTFDNAVYDANGKWYDLTLTMDEFQLMGSAFEDTTDVSCIFLDYRTTTQHLYRSNNMFGAQPYQGLSSTIKLSISSKSGSSVPDGTIMLYFQDLDISGVNTTTWERPAIYGDEASFVESITPIKGLKSPYYVTEDTLLEVRESDGRISGTAMTSSHTRASCFVEADLANGVEFKWELTHASSLLFSTRDVHYPGGGGLSLQKTDAALG